MGATKINAELQIKLGSIIGSLIAEDTIEVSKLDQTGLQSFVQDEISSAQLGNEWQKSVIDLLNTPPGSPATGARYLIGDTPTGAWVGKANNIAEWNGSAWVYTEPAVGMFVSVDDVTDGIYYYGGSWTKKSFEVSTEGNGIDITSGVVSAVAAPGGCIEVTASGIDVVDNTIDETKVKDTALGIGIKGGNGSTVELDRVIEKYTATTDQTDFELTNVPPTDDAMVDVFVNGILQEEGESSDYMIAGTSDKTVMFNDGLQAGDKVIVKYFK